MIFKVNDSLPSDDINNHWSETYYDGAEGSFVPSVPPHWHKYHDEHMQVIKGRVELNHSGKTIVAKPGDDVYVIPRMDTHGFKFFKGEPTILKEFTNPAGNFKEAFFEDLLDDGSLNAISAIRAGYYGDTYVALPGHFMWLEQALSLGVGGIVAYFWPQKNKGMLAESAKKAGVAAA